MNDASEVLGVIFDCLHRSFTSSSISGILGLWKQHLFSYLAKYFLLFPENQNPIFIGFDT